MSMEKDEMRCVFVCVCVYVFEGMRVYLFQ